MRREHRSRVRIGEEAQLEVTRGGRPDTQGSLAVAETRTERERRRLRGVEVIEHTGNLQRCGVDALAGARRAHGELAFEALSGGRDGSGGKFERGKIREMREP